MKNKVLLSNVMFVELKFLQFKCTGRSSPASLCICLRRWIRNSVVTKSAKNWAWVAWQQCPARTPPFEYEVAVKVLEYKAKIGQRSDLSGSNFTPGLLPCHFYLSDVISLQENCPDCAASIYGFKFSLIALCRTIDRSSAAPFTFPILPRTSARRK